MKFRLELTAIAGNLHICMITYQFHFANKLVRAFTERTQSIHRLELRMNRRMESSFGPYIIIIECK